MRDVAMKWRPEAGLTVVMAAKGYPAAYPSGSVIRNLEAVTGAKVGAQHCLSRRSWAFSGMSVGAQPTISYFDLFQPLLFYL